MLGLTLRHDDAGGWPRTLVAELGGETVATATLTRNGVHPGRYPLALEVNPAHRRRGIASALVAALRERRPEPLPMSARIRPDDPAAVGLLRHLGGRVYQHCPGQRIDLAAVPEWCARQLPPDDVAVRSLTELTDDERTALWVEQYTWVHRTWSAAAPVRLQELAPGVVAEADPERSSVAVRGGEVAAVAWIFAEADGSATIVSETARGRSADGVALVAAALARSLSLLAQARPSFVEVDGHADDPHLQRALSSVPLVGTAPIDLVEID